MENVIKNIDDFNDLLKRAEGGNADAQFDVSLFYTDGLVINDIATIKPDAQLAFYWTKKAYEGGYGEPALVHYGNFLCAGEGCDKNVELGMKVYQEGADLGWGSSARCLGMQYRNRQNYKKAFELYNNPHGDGKPDDRVTVGLCYYHGVGVAQNKLKALELFQQVSTDNDDAGYDVNEANYMIGRMYLEGEVVERSFDAAREYLELANEDRDHRSANELLMIIGRKWQLTPIVS